MKILSPSLFLSWHMNRLVVIKDEVNWKRHILVRFCVFGCRLKNELVILSVPGFLVASHHSKWSFGSGGACYCHKSIVFFLVRFLFSWKWKIGVWQLQQPLSGLASLNTKHNTEFSSSSRIIVGNISKIIFAHSLPERKKTGV